MPTGNSISSLLNWKALWALAKPKLKASIKKLAYLKKAKIPKLVSTLNINSWRGEAEIHVFQGEVIAQFVVTEDGRSLDADW